VIAALLDSFRQDLQPQCPAGAHKAGRGCGLYPPYALKEVTAKDHIHFTAEGYANIVKQVLSTRNIPQKTPSQRLDAKKYYWRGFRSSVGAISVAGFTRNARGHYKAHRTLHHHPYRR
jgi:hypothetical protein